MTFFFFFNCQVTFHCMNVPWLGFLFCFHSLVEGHLGCPVLRHHEVMSRTAMNICVQAFVGT